MSRTPDATLRERAAALGLHGLLARWHAVETESWLLPLITAEETERCRRSLERRISHAALGSFKPIADFDWAHPRKIDREAIEALFELDFLREHINVVFIGSGGVGKTMLAQNLAHRAILAGHTARFVSAAAMLADLAAQDGPASLRRRLRHYTSPSLLVLDEVGYMSYGQGYADLLFQVVSQRYQRRSTIVSTNRVFTEWSEVFPNATSIIALIDRLCHNAEIVSIDADSYRNKETQERIAARKTARRSTRKP